MEHIVVSSVPELLEVLLPRKNREVVFRGVKDASYQLIPSLGRIDVHESFRDMLEKWVMTEFKNRSAPYIGKTPSNDWEWLVLAQHYGTPTRLLDWTENPLAATFFAVEEPFDGDSAIYIFKFGFYKTTQFSVPPSEFEELFLLRPPHISRNISAQEGVFTAHPQPFEPYDSKDVEKIIVKSESRERIQEELDRLAINRGTLFPGLEGISEYIHWEVKNRYR